jgi:hypothetical protein
MDKRDSLIKAGYSRNYANGPGIHLFDRQEVIDAITEMQVKQELKSEVSRDDCIKKLLDYIDNSDCSVRDKISALSLIADLCGFKRETAPNAEKEAIKASRMGERAKQLNEAALKEVVKEESVELVKVLNFQELRKEAV